MSPVFNLKCKECGEVKEYIILNGKEPSCEKCGSTNLERLFSTFTFRMKYPMWVDKVDDYQKRQEDRGIEPTLPHPSEVL